ncbi:MAG: aspartate/glutamate racemase family protein [Candidatus Bathyarchaeaceae archaeon]
MRILVVNPVGTDMWDKKDKGYLQKFARKDTLINVLSLKEGPASLETFQSMAYVCPSIIQLAKKHEGKYDAIMVNCFGDPCVKALREIVDVPVLGPGETSMLIASLLGHKFSVISPTKKTALQVELHARELGIEERLASVVGLEIPVLELERDEEKTIKAVVKASEKAVKDGAEVIVLGCTGLAYMANEIRKRLDAPLIEPASLTLKLAEALFDLGLRHSKISLYGT